VKRVVEIWYDVVCPYAYLGSTQIERVAVNAGAEVSWHPFLLGGVLRAVGTADNAMAQMSGPRLRHNWLDMHRWAEHFDVPLEMPMAHPRRTVLAMRAILAAGEAGRLPATRALFDAYWARGEDVADPAIVASALDRAGLDGAACVARAGEQAIKDELRARTDEAIARGIFGAPTFFVGTAMYWGQDRLGFVERALA
jgi:2-hydroxychromene-2-carboxylate isomerase